MTVLEAGIIAGAFGGAGVGIVLGSRIGVWGGLGAGAAGVTTGAIAGWLFALALIGLLSVVGVLWRATGKGGVHPPTESDIRTMTPVAVAGTFITTLVGLAVLAAVNWRVALASVMVLTFLTAFLAVARYELGKPG